MSNNYRTALLALVCLALWPVAAASQPQGHGLALKTVLTGHWAGLPAQDDPAFGFSVAMDGDWLAVGAPLAIVDRGQYGVHRHGAVFLYHREQGHWSYRQTLVDGGYGDSQCGFDVAIDVPWLILGCPGADKTVPLTKTGIVSVYQLGSSGGAPHWFHDFSRNGPDHARCGAAVGISNGGTILIIGGSLADPPVLAYGCPENDGIHQGTGFVRVWGVDGQTGSWLALDTLTASDGDMGDAFGTSVALAEDRGLFGSISNWLAVGAPGNDLAGHFNNGRVYVFRGNNAGGSWYEHSTMAPQYASSYDNTQYGEAVALVGDDLVIGAPSGYREDCPGLGARCGYIEYWYFNNSSTNPAWLYGWDDEVDGSDNGGGNPPGPQAGMRYGDAVAIAGNGRIAGGAPETDGFRQGGGLADAAGYVQFRLATTNPTLAVAGLRPSVGPSGPDVGHFGFSLDFGSEYRLAVGAPGFRGAGSAPGSVYIYEYDFIFRDGFDDGGGIVISLAK